MKIALKYSYNGSKFSGSQTQPNMLAVEDAINQALNHIGIYEPILSGSRTDKGVHALNQISTLHCGDFWELDRLKSQINRHLSPYISIKDIFIVDESFHPRFSAVAREYRYIIYHGEKSPFLSDFVYFYPNLDLKRLNLALNYFIGKQDFKPFYKVGSGEKSTIREIYKAYAYQISKTTFGLKRYNSKPNLTIIKFKANGFLRAQVRLMVANALKAASSDENLCEFIKLYRSQKPLTKIPAPPNGLYLKKVFFKN
ncbi:tRNA pseudouridine(38-40) synthase TruA [Campylobacter lanienae]|uniref:tRNA pseudouridine(38-40) synthase TruA n=1 Tax=Campylobacter lanienae TaxID=75658 RepID=UPI000BB41588|nr:tRNA pseudouridine(38-40) synthase TruA [Campylobacter lanienae]